jgi:hypothetical protein
MDVQADTYYCDMPLNEQWEECNGYEARVVSAVDTMYTYYYDAGSGALVAITLGNGTTSTCVAGPATFMPPTCGTGRSLADRCPTPGTDAGAPPDGAARGARGD